MSDTASPPRTDASEAVLGDGTRVECWHDGEYYRAVVRFEGPEFVRIDTVEALRSNTPSRHVRILARTISDVIVFRSCKKSAMLLREFDRMCEGAR